MKTMKTTHEGECTCCASKGLPSRVVIVVDGDDIDARCETHGPWLAFPAPTRDVIMAAHRKKLESAKG